MLKGEEGITRRSDRAQEGEARGLTAWRPLARDLGKNDARGVGSKMEKRKRGLQAPLGESGRGWWLEAGGVKPPLVSLVAKAEHREEGPREGLMLVAGDRREGKLQPAASSGSWVRHLWKSPSGGFYFLSERGRRAPSLEKMLRFEEREREAAVRLG